MNGFVKIIVAIIVVAIIAVVISKKAQTTNVINAASSFFDGLLKDILAPITGSTAGAAAPIGSSAGVSTSTLFGLQNFGSLPSFGI